MLTKGDIDHGKQIGMQIPWLTLPCGRRIYQTKIDYDTFVEKNVILQRNALKS